jgi:hypothetical protein
MKAKIFREFKNKMNGSKIWKIFKIYILLKLDLIGINGLRHKLNQRV